MRDELPDRRRFDIGGPGAGVITFPVVIGTLIAAGVLHLGKDVFLPLAIALLITFTLSPLVSALRGRGIPLTASVLAVVTVTFLLIGVLGLIVVSQLGLLAQGLPTFQSNIMQKLADIQSAGGGGVLSRLVEMAENINDRISAAVPTSVGEDTGQAVVPVEVVERQGAFEMLRNLVVPLVSPIATGGLVIVVVIFMLLEREELRDRFIRLIGANDLHRTTEVLEDAGARVGNYLLTQLLVNVIYAVPIAVGLWLIGVPNAPLWGLLTLILRFVPYIGSVLAAAFPIFLAFAVSPDWSAVLWTIALFAAVELVTSNVIEPWLYGSKTGVSPLAIIVAAIFWTWIWGAPGLILSTPLTVCLVVLGRHIPQFQLFDILFGDEPVLEPHARLYQRLLAGDAIEAIARAEEALEAEYLGDYYRDVGIPALLLAQSDLDRGVVTSAQEERLAETADKLVSDLDEVAEAEIDAAANGDGDEALPGLGYSVTVIGGRSRLDDVAARMLAQALRTEGAGARAEGRLTLLPGAIEGLAAGEKGCLLLSFLDQAPTRASLLHIRRLKRAHPSQRVGVAILAVPEGAGGGFVAPSDKKRTEALEVGADFVVNGLDELHQAAFTNTPPKPLGPDKRPPRRGARSRVRSESPAA